jgi:hypothetical protein
MVTFTALPLAGQPEPHVTNVNVSIVRQVLPKANRGPLRLPDMSSPASSVPVR